MSGTGPAPKRPGLVSVVAAVALLVAASSAAYFVLQSQHQSQPPPALELYIGVAGGPNHVPDTGSNYTFTAYVRPDCKPGQLCPDFVELAPSAGVTWTFGDGTSAVGNPVAHSFPGFIQWSGCYTATVHYDGMTASIDAQTGGPATC